MVRAIRRLTGYVSGEKGGLILGTTKKGGLLFSVIIDSRVFYGFKWSEYQYTSWCKNWESL